MMHRSAFGRLAGVAAGACLAVAVAVLSSQPGVDAPRDVPPETDGAQRQFVDGRLVVRTVSPEWPEAAEQAAEELGFRLASRVPQLNLHVLEGPGGIEAVAAARLRVLPAVLSAEREARLTSLLVPNDAFYRSHQWNLNKIGMEAAWNITAGNPDVVVAVLDTGADYEHPDLRANLLPGYDFLDDDPVADDRSSHGTHTAGIIGALGDNRIGIAGMAWRSRIMPIKVLDERGSGGEGSALVKGIVYAVDHGARVLNISSGTPVASAAIEEAVRYAASKGALLVSAAGNSGDRENSVLYPAAYPQVLAVGATDKDDTAWVSTQRQAYVEVAAPGVDVPSTFWTGSPAGPYGAGTGTSAAAAHVSALAALIWGLEPRLSADEVRQIITSTADDLGLRGRDPLFGYGRINAFRALVELRPQFAPQPTPVPTPALPPLPLPTLVTLPEMSSKEPETGTWFFAEGSTNEPFETWVTLFNPNEVNNSVRLTYTTTAGGPFQQSLSLPPLNSVSILVNEVVPRAEVSIRVDSEAPVAAERAMYFGHDGHATGGVASASTNWFLAEGSSQEPFDTWLLIQNPNPTPASARLTFMLEDGSRQDRFELIPPNSRRSIYVNLLFQATGFSTQVVADLPVIVERAMYFDQARAGHGVMASKAAALVWYFAEGDSRNGFDTWLLLQNPGNSPASVRVTYFLEQGTSLASTHQVPARSRRSIYVNQVLPGSAFGMRVEADQPVVAERAMYFGERGGHASPGQTALSREWFVVAGGKRPTSQEIVSVLNPNPSPTEIDLNLFESDGQPHVPTRLAVPSNARLTLELRFVQEAGGSARLLSDQPIVVERSSYFANGDGGTNAPGLGR